MYSHEGPLGNIQYNDVHCADIAVTHDGGPERGRRGEWTGDGIHKSQRILSQKQTTRRMESQQLHNRRARTWTYMYMYMY